MATHSNILAWTIPWMEESGWLQAMAGCKESDVAEWLTPSYKYLAYSIGYILTHIPVKSSLQSSFLMSLCNSYLLLVPVPLLH